MISTSWSPAPAYTAGIVVFVLLKSTAKCEKKLLWGMFSSLGGNICHMIKSQDTWMAHRKLASGLFEES